MSETQDSQKKTWAVRSGDAPGLILMDGEIDFSVTPKVREALLQLVGDSPRDIVLDLSGLDYIDSSGLALLLELRRQLVDTGRSVRIRAITSQVRKLFNLTQLGDLFDLPEQG